MTRRDVVSNDQPIDTAHNNPLIDSRQYEFEFVDSHSEVIAADVLAENSIVYVDQDAHRQCMFTEIIDHQCDDKAIAKGDDMFETSRRLIQNRRTTAG